MEQFEEKLRGLERSPDCKLRRIGLGPEFEGYPAKNDRVVDSATSAAAFEKSITQIEIEWFRLSLEHSIVLVHRLEYPHGLARRAIVCEPNGSGLFP